MIKKVGDEYILYTSDGKRILGKHKTKSGALAQERAIYASKAKKEK